MEVSAGTCIAVEVGVGGGLIHTGPDEPELEGSQTKYKAIQLILEEGQIRLTCPSGN